MYQEVLAVQRGCNIDFMYTDGLLQKFDNADFFPSSPLCIYCMSEMRICASVTMSQLKLIESTGSIFMPT